MVPIATRLILHGGSQGAFIEREEKRRRQCRKWEEEVVLSLASRLHLPMRFPCSQRLYGSAYKRKQTHILSHTQCTSHTHQGTLEMCNIVCARLAETSYVGAEIVWNNIARIKQAICRPMSCVILAFKWKAKLTTGFIWSFSIGCNKSLPSRGLYAGHVYWTCLKSQTQNVATPQINRQLDESPMKLY